MPHRWSRLVALGGLACVLAVSGCVGAEPAEPSPSPTASPEPVFASEEEALAAATDVFSRYNTLADQIVADGGDRVDRLAPLVTEQYLKTEDEGYEQIRAQGLKGVGASSFDTFSMQNFDSSMSRGDILQAYVCSDVTHVRLVNRSGADVTPSDRDNRLPLVVSFLLSGDVTTPLLIDGSETWSGENFC